MSLLKHRVAFVLPLFLSFSFPHAAFAWDTVTGKVTRIHAVSGVGGAPGNYDLRVFLDTQPVCSGAADATWGYVNSNDANYKSMVAMVISAQASGSAVTLYSQLGPTGYCQIASMIVATN